MTSSKRVFETSYRAKAEVLCSCQRLSSVAEYCSSDCRSYHEGKSRCRNW